VVVEKGSEVGAHIMSGAVIDPSGLDALLPGWRDEDTPVKTAVRDDRFYLLGPAGALPAMLNSVSEFYEEDVQNALATAMALIEPVILIVMGVVVAFVLISLYLPIFSLGSEGLH
jgi:Type II secretion system (T2SS), protein F